jgi:TetR/AcrR family transcriptional regulator, cholesterol catabolism regulator
MFPGELLTLSNMGGTNMDTSSRIQLTVLDQIANADRVRKKIIDAASALYVKKGFNATSIQEISEASGVSLPVTYHYVKQKSAIMRMIMEDVLNIFRENLLRMIHGIEDPIEKLTIAGRLYFKVVDQQREKALLIYQKSNSLDKASKARIMELEVEVSKIFGEMIQEGIALGVFKKVDVDLAAYNIIIAAHMWVLKHWHFKNRLTLDKYIDLQLSNILDTLKI